jgi:hypothetical protein
MIDIHSTRSHLFFFCSFSPETISKTYARGVKERETRWKLQNHHFSSIEDEDELCIVVIIVIVGTTTRTLTVVVITKTKSRRLHSQKPSRESWMMVPRRLYRLSRMKKKTKKKKKTKEEDNAIVIIITIIRVMFARGRRVLLPSENDRR